MNKSDQNEILYRCIQKVATGPGYSKSLPQEDARDALLTILDGSADPVRAGVFLIALRMKRESMEENKGFLEALLNTSNQVTAEVDSVIDIAEPYNGYVRGLSVTAFLAPLLATLLAGKSEAAYSHGVESVGPKYGLTHYKVLKSLGINVDISVEEAALQLANPDIGWAYVDQKAVNPSLNSLVGLRERLIKRSALTTVEVLLKPLSGRKETHFISGYVHSEYPPIYCELARFAGFDTAALVRGVEGGITPSLQQQGKYYAYYDRGEETLQQLDPKGIGINVKKRAIPLPDNLPEPTPEEGAINADAASAKAAEMGIAALKGEPGLAYDSLLYNAAIALLHRKHFDSLPEAAHAVRKVMDSGAVLERLKAVGASF